MGGGGWGEWSRCLLIDAVQRGERREERGVWWCASGLPTMTHAGGQTGERLRVPLETNNSQLRNTKNCSVFVVENC